MLVLYLSSLSLIICRIRFKPKLLPTFKPFRRRLILKSMTCIKHMCNLPLLLHSKLKKLSASLPMESPTRKVRLLCNLLRLSLSRKPLLPSPLLNARRATFWRSQTALAPPAQRDASRVLWPPTVLSAPSGLCRKPTTARKSVEMADVLFCSATTGMFLTATVAQETALWKTDTLALAVLPTPRMYAQ